MTFKTRLDPLLRLRQRQEDDARQQLSSAEATWRRADDAATQILRASVAPRAPERDSALAELSELAATRQRHDLARAQQHARECAALSQRAKDAFVSARQATHTVETLVEKKRAEARRAEDRAEAKALDELALRRR